MLSGWFGSGPDRTDPADTSGFEGVNNDGRRSWNASRLVSRDSSRSSSTPADEHSMLVVLQGMDSAGKDGTIRRSFQGR